MPLTQDQKPDAATTRRVAALQRASRQFDLTKANLERLIVEAHLNGVPLRVIARATHRSHATIIYTLKAHNAYVPAPKDSE